MLAHVHRESFFADLKAILNVRSWTQQQVDGLERLVGNFERDPLVPDGRVGVQRVAYWLYTDWIETGHTFTPIMERGSAQYFISRYGPQTRKGRELGNDTNQEAIDYRGAGDVQLTGENNREAAEEMIRRNYPEMVAAWEAETGRYWDLTVGDQPDDRDDWKNALIPEFSYAIMVAGTTEGLFGPPLNRYINVRGCDYKGARACVNGRDRNVEFAAYCPRIERALERAIARARTEDAATADAAAIASGGGGAAASTPEPTLVAAAAPTSTDSAEARSTATAEQAAAGSLQKVTAGSGSWVRTALGWLTTIFTTASSYVRDALGLDASVQKILIGLAVALGITYMILKFLAERQVRAIASNPELKDVK